MGILDLIKPKWKHSDAEVRANAVRDLGAAEIAVLEAVARGDSDVRVRRIAVKRIDDPAVLRSIAEHESNGALRRMATERAVRFLIAAAINAEDPVEGEQALENLTTSKALAEVAKQANLEAVRSGALGRLEDDRAVADVAHNAAVAATRELAVERLDDAAALRRIALEDPAEEVAMAALAKIESGAALAAISNKSKSKAVRTAAQKRAAALRPGKCRKRRAKVPPETSEPDAAAQPSDEVAAATERPPVEAVTPAVPEIDPEPQRRAEVEVQTAPLRPERASRDAKKEQEEKREQERAGLARLEAKCEKLEALVTSEEIKAVSRGARSLQKLAGSLGPIPRDARRGIRERIETARKGLSARLEELRALEDWKRWTNVPRLEELCSRVEALLTMEDRAEAARRLSAARAEWKSIGPASAKKAGVLWRRFSTAAEKVQEHCREHFETLKAQRAENLKSKEALCEKVEALADSTDWRETTEHIKALQAEWKSLGPVPRELGDALWKRFRGACDRFFERREKELDTERAPNLARKQALCDQVEALVDSTSWRETTEQIKTLQAEWRSIGHVPREHSDAVWKRFRGACDRFFERRKQSYAERDADRKQNLQAKVLLCEKVEALIDRDDVGEADRIVSELHAEWKTIGPVPHKKSDAIWNRFRDASDRVRGAARARRADAAKTAPGEPTGTRGKKKKKEEEKVPTLMEQRLREAGLLGD